MTDSAKRHGPSASVGTGLRSAPVASPLVSPRGSIGGAVRNRVANASRPKPSADAETGGLAASESGPLARKEGEREATPEETDENEIRPDPGAERRGLGSAGAGSVADAANERAVRAFLVEAGLEASELNAPLPELREKVGRALEIARRRRLGIAKPMSSRASHGHTM